MKVMRQSKGYDFCYLYPNLLILCIQRKIKYIYTIYISQYLSMHIYWYQDINIIIIRVKNWSVWVLKTAK